MRVTTEIQGISKELFVRDNDKNVADFVNAVFYTLKTTGSVPIENIVVTSVDWVEREDDYTKTYLRRSLLSSVQITFIAVINTAGGLIASALISTMAATLDTHLVVSLQALPRNSALAVVYHVLVIHFEAPTTAPSIAPTTFEEPDANPILAPIVAAILLIGLFAYHANNTDWKTSIIVSFARMGTRRDKDKNKDKDKDKDNKTWRFNQESEVQCLTLAQLRERKAKKLALLSRSSIQVVPCSPEMDNEDEIEGSVSLDHLDCVVGNSDEPQKFVTWDALEQLKQAEAEPGEEETKTQDSTLLDDSWEALFATSTKEDNERTLNTPPLKPTPLFGDVVGEGQFKLRPGSRHLSARPIYDQDSERTRPPLHLLRIQSPLRSATANSLAARRTQEGNSAGIEGMLSRPATVSPDTCSEPSAARPYTNDIEPSLRLTPTTKPNER